MVSEDILMFSHYKSMGIIDPQGEAGDYGQFGFQRLDWQDLCCGALDVATY